MHGPFDTYKEFNSAWFGSCTYVIAHLCMRFICMSPISTATLSQYRSIVLEFQRCLCFHWLSSVQYGSFHSISFDCSHGWLGLCVVTTWERFKVPLLPLLIHWNKRRRRSEMRRKHKRLGQNRRNVHVYINWRGCRRRCCCCCFLAVLLVPPCDCVITIDREWLWRTHYYHFTVDWTKLQYI